MTAKIPRAPKILGKPGKRFWKEVLSDYQLEDFHHLKLLTEGCSCIDRITQIQDQVAIDGILQINRFGEKRIHPLIQEERAQRLTFCRVMRELSLDIQTQPDKNPPRLYK